MDRFIVSARKYRPNDFSSLIGQESIAVTLKNSIQRGQLAHAYLFCGPRGVGKTSTARIFAKTINCMNPGPDMEPCGECESCISFAEGRSYCIHELDAASNNSVDDIRLITEKVMIPPQVGKYSVYIIDEVHMLSSAAFNAFLKTLEEPPAHAIFILATTEKHKILPTILSRCQTYDFNRISIEDIVKNLASIAKNEGIKVDTESLHVIAGKADGAMRDALTLFDQCVAFCGTNIEYSAVIKNLNVLDHEYYFNIVECALQGNFSKQLLLFDEVLSKGFNALYFISGLSTHLRNLLVCKDASTLKLLEMAPALAERYKAQSAVCSLKFLYEALGQTTKCESEYRQSGNQRLLVEFLLVRLSQIAMPAASQTAISVGAASAPVQQQEPVKKTNIPQRPLGPEQQSSAEEVSQMGKNSVASGEASGEVSGEASGAGQQSATEQASALEQHLAVGDVDGSGQQSAVGDASGAGQKPASTPPAFAGGLSIKNIMKKAQTAPKTAEQRTVVEVEPVTIEKLNVVWNRMADTQSHYPRLASAIRQTSPILKEDGTTIVFKVGNSAQQSWIEKNSLPVLTGFLQRELNNGNIKLIVDVIEVEAQEKKPYTPYEKADHIRKNYPDLLNLEKELDLDIK